MATAGQYQHRLNEILAAENEPAAQLDQLRQLDEDIQREIVTLRAQFHSRISAANTGAGGSRVMNSNRHAASEGRRAEQVTRLEEERDGKIEPYAQVKTSLDEALARLEPGQNSG